LGIGTHAVDPPYGVAEPTQVGTDSDWRSVSAGGYHNVALRANGTLWGWGANRESQLDSEMLATSIYNSTNRPVQLGTNENWQSVSAGGSHSMAISSSHALLAWGSDQDGQLGIETSDNKHGARYPAAAGSAPWQVGSHADWQASCLRPIPHGGVAW